LQNRRLRLRRQIDQIEAAPHGIAVGQHQPLHVEHDGVTQIGVVAQALDDFLQAGEVARGEPDGRSRGDAARQRLRLQGLLEHHMILLVPYRSLDEQQHDRSHQHGHADSQLTAQRAEQPAF